MTPVAQRIPAPVCPNDLPAGGASPAPGVYKALNN